LPEPEKPSRSGGRGIPLRHGGGSGFAHRDSGDEMTLDVEGFVDCRARGNEALRLALRI